MKRTEIIDLFRTQEAREISVSGWIRTNRHSAQIGFIELNDGSSFLNLQVVYEASLPNFDEVSRYSISSSIEIVGDLILTPENKQPFELHAKEIKLLGEADKEYPLQKKRHSFEYLRTQLTLRPRTNTFMAVFRVRSILAMTIHEFFQKEGFVYIHTPILTGNDAEGAGEMFQVTTLDMKNIPRTEEGHIDYSKELFGKKMGLTVSGQLAVEPFAHSFGKVYTFGPTFRAENSNTLRHANEFWMIEPEMSFCDLDMDMDVIERMLKYIIRETMERAPQEMAFLNERIDPTLIERLELVVNTPFKRMTYTEAIEVLKASGEAFEYAPEWGKEIQTEHEKYLAGVYAKGPVFVTDYPKDVKAFYMKQNPDGRTVRAVDLLVPQIGEIVGGSQREDDYEVLKREILARGMELSGYEWYLDLRRYGTTVHSGFGLGFERAVQYITGMSNIRDVQAYPRTPKSAEF
ncbi:asparagine--tRNA ligase [Guggenheimella bovis]